jgi:hypothetical protein
MDDTDQVALKLAEHNEAGSQEDEGAVPEGHSDSSPVRSAGKIREDAFRPGEDG